MITSNPSQLDIQWGIPYSHADYPVLSYDIQIVNTSSGDTLESVLNYNDTSYEYTFDDNIQYPKASQLVRADLYVIKEQ